MSEYKTMSQTVREVTEAEVVTEAPLVMDLVPAAELIMKYIHKDIAANRKNEKGEALLKQIASLAGLEATFKGQAKGRVFIWDLAKRKK